MGAGAQPPKTCCGSKIHTNTLLIQLIWEQIADMAALGAPDSLSSLTVVAESLVCHQSQGTSCSFTQHSELGTCCIGSFVS